MERVDRIINEDAQCQSQRECETRSERAMNSEEIEHNILLHRGKQSSLENTVSGSLLAHGIKHSDRSGFDRPPFNC